MMKNQKGITLIALVITIIVLLILAGVSIAMLTGENGILKQASNSVDETKISEEKEQVSIAINALTSEFYEKKYVEKNTTVTTQGLGAYVLAGLKSGTNSVAAYVDFDDTTDGKMTTKSVNKDGKKESATFNVSKGELGAWTAE